MPRAEPNVDGVSLCGIFTASYQEGLGGTELDEADDDADHPGVGLEEEVEDSQDDPLLQNI